MSQYPDYRPSGSQKPYHVSGGTSQGGESQLREQKGEHEKKDADIVQSGSAEDSKSSEKSGQHDGSKGDGHGKKDKKNGDDGFSWGETAALGCELALHLANK